MALIVHSLALDTIAALRPLLPRIQRHDRALALQLGKAASSVALNIGEAEYSDPGTRRARFCSAAGSAGESRTALEVALAWGYVTAEQVAPALGLLDRVLGMLWRLSRRC
jgi:four helix bundle protein